MSSFFVVINVGSAPNYVSLTVIPRSFCNPQLQIKLGENFYCLKQCCGSGSGIRCFFGPEIRIMDPGWKKIQIRDEHSGSYFCELSISFWVKNNKIFDPDPRDLFNPGSGIRDLGWKKVGSGIPDKHPGSAPLVLSSYLFYSSPWNCMNLIRIKISSNPSLW